MLLHEKMRLQRKQNKLTLKQLHNGSQLSRMESRIKKREKYYAKLKKQIETQGNLYKNMAQTMISNQFGIGTGSWNPNQLFMGGGVGLNQTQMQLIQQVAEQTGVTNAADYIALMINNPMAFSQKDSGQTKDNDGKTKIYNYEIQGYEGTTLSSEEYQKIYQATQQVKYAQNQYGQMAQQWKAEYENNVSIWIQAQTEQIEAQEEWEMDMLGEEQADYEAEKESIAAELELIKQRKEAIEQELGSSIKDAAPKFGLA